MAEGSPVTTVAPETRIYLVRIDGNITVRVSMVNREGSPFQLLRWNLPDNGKLSTALFDIYHDGQRVEYKGIMAKRMVTAADYLALEPGREYSTEISLAQGYDVNPKGRYKIQYKASNQTLDGNRVGRIVSNELVADKY